MNDLELLRFFYGWSLGNLCSGATKAAWAVPLRALVHRPGLDGEKLCIVGDDTALNRFLRIIWRSGKRCVACSLFGVDPEKPPGIHACVTRAFD